MILFLNSFIVLNILYFYLKKVSNQSTQTVSLTEIIVFALLNVSILSWIYAESASFFNSIKEITAKGYWITIVIIQTGILLLNFRHTSITNLVSISKNWLINYYRNSTKIELVIYSIIGLFILTPLLYQAVLVPPNNYDSHHYHLHRIIAWTYYQNLDHYPTEHLQQLYHNVFSEYLLLNVYLLNNSSDTYVNLIQYIAGLAGMLLIKAIAKQIGLSREGQLIAMVLFLTLPVVLFEMTTTQVDLLATFYFLTFIYFGFKLINQFNTTSLLNMAIALVLAGFTKYPTLLYALPFCIYFGINYLKNLNLYQSIIILLTCCFTFILIFTPFLHRNYTLFGHPLSPSIDSVFFAEGIPTEAYSPSYTLLNSIKNLSLHLGLPHTGYNQYMTNQIEAIHNIFKVDINQPEISIDSYQIRYSVHEDMVPNTIHFLLLIIAGTALFFRSALKKVQLLWILALCGFVLFCTIFKFQLWSTRTHLPFFAIGTICIGAVIQFTPRVIQLITLSILLCSTTIYVFSNPSKPLLPLTFLAKKILAQIPADICPQSEEEALKYKDHLTQYYNFEAIGTCYPLKKSFNYSNRKDIQNKLIELDYYSSIQKSILDIPTHQAYFMNMKDRFHHFWPLTTHIISDNPVIGFITTRSDGAYFYQASLKKSLQQNAQFLYIYSKAEFKGIKNYQIPLPYQYILTDNLPLTETIVDSTFIKAIHPSSDGLALIELTEPSYKMYGY